MSDDIPSQKLIEMYRKMLEIRNFEQRVYYLFLEGLIPGTLHLYTGEEAVAVGVCSSLRKDDFIVSTHRPHGHYIAKGGQINEIMAELFGKKTGCCKGKGGSMHISSFSTGMPPAIAIVGANAPIAAGMALALKMKGTDQVVACFFGDGAVNQGMWHEGVNIAAVWKLPVVLVCENNLYAASTHVSKAMLVKNIAERASAYGIPGVIVDGNDVIAIYEETSRAVERARRREGPTLVECLTFRHGGHSRGDPGTYRLKEEVEEWLKKDPIPRFKDKLIKMGVLTAEQAEEIERNVLAQIEEAVKFAKESPFPEPDIALEDIYS